MSAARILYRTRQFWQFLRLVPTEQELEGVRSVLNPAQLDLFFRMQPGEQSHSIRVYTTLVEAGENNPHLLAAALLHDIGKTRYHLKPWERAWAVIGKLIFPHLSRQWSTIELKDPQHAEIWKRPFVVAEQHPDWGAKLAGQAGASKCTVSLIRRHQESLPRRTQMGTTGNVNEPKPDQEETRKLEDWLLQKLQAADNES